MIDLLVILFNKCNIWHTITNKKNSAENSHYNGENLVTCYMNLYCITCKKIANLIYNLIFLIFIIIF